MAAYRLISQVILVRVLETLCGAGFVSMTIIPDTDTSLNDHEQSRHRGRNDHHDKPGNVTRTVLVLEDKGSDEVACNPISGRLRTENMAD